MKQQHPIRTRTTGQAGFSLIEVLVAMVVLGVGLLGSIGLICAAAASNSGSKLNTTAATLAESTLERLVAVPQGGGNGPLTSLTDCQGNVFSMDTSLGGSPAPPSGPITAIDFHQAPVPNYSMQYVMCSGGQNLTYDVRWRVDAGPTIATQLITVSVRSQTTAGPAAALARPITLRTLRGN